MALVFLPLVFLLLLSEGVNMAPTIREREEAEAVDIDMDMDGEDFNSTAAIQAELDQLLRNGLLNQTENIDKIKTAFRDLIQTGNTKLCIRLNYTVTCASEEQDCDNGTTSNFNCSTDYSSAFVWTSFDPTTLSGAFLFQYAILNWEVFGLTWNGACDLNPANTPVLSIHVPSLTLLCGMDEDEYLAESLGMLIRQMPLFANASATVMSYSAKDGSTFPYIILVSIFIIAPLSFLIQLTIHPVIKNQVESTTRTKPKAYFQFWASQIFYVGFGVYTAVTNLFYNSNPVYNGWTLGVVIAYTVIILGGLVINAIFNCKFAHHDINTPTQCRHCLCLTYEKTKCCENSWNSRHRTCHCILVYISAYIMFIFINLFLTLTPTIILIYYLYPVQTLARIPFVLTSILYINSLLALLIFQSELFCTVLVSSKFDGKTTDDYDNCFLGKFDSEAKALYKERAQYHQDFYNDYTDDNDRVRHITDADGRISWRNFLPYALKYLCQPLGTLILLVLLIIFIVIISGLINIDISKFSDGTTQLEILVTLVPTLLLFFGSWYKIDFFFDFEKEKSQQELLKEVLDKFETSNQYLKEIKDPKKETKEVLHSKPVKFSDIRLTRAPKRSSSLPNISSS